MENDCPECSQTYLKAVTQCAEKRRHSTFASNLAKC